ncbi:MAG: undecaprenyl-phosphate glucose phosphotransferase [Dehalococcoidia bacterium]|nr:undecaprenyl-phosphate glucose phosphotransferase [Dehalococcoidia bacterium]
MSRTLSRAVTTPVPARPPQAPRRVSARLLPVIGLLAGDIALANLAFVLAYWVRYDLRWAPPVGSEFVDVPLGNYTGPQLLVTAILIAVFLWRGLYRQRRGRQWLDEVGSIVTGSIFGFATLIVLFFILRPEIGIYSRAMILYPWLGVVVLLSAFRLFVRTASAWRRRRGRGLRRLLVVGAGTRGKMVMQQVEQHPGLGYQPVGFLDDVAWAQRADFGRFRVQGAIDDLPRVAAAQQIDEVVVAIPSESHETILRTLNYCARSDISFKLVPDLFELTLGDVEVDDLAGIPLIGVRDSLLTGLNLGVKRAMDVVIATVVLLVTLPLSLVLTLAIRLGSAGPFLLPQRRVGQDGRPFRMFKFRSMYQDAEQRRAELQALNEVDGPLFKMRDDPRITKVGKFMRRFSLDELPQLWNVVRGEMSLVGPRAPLAGEVEQYDAWQTRRLAVTPGLTGLWQVSGRSELSFDEMVMLDFYYIENWSIGLDVKILLRTLPAVLSGHGAY